MDRMDKIKLVKMLKTLPIPVAHVAFIEPQTAPYLIYLDEMCQITAANSRYIGENTLIQLELYTKYAQTDECENIVEILLNDFTTYEKSRSFISEEGLCVTYYNFYL